MSVKTYSAGDVQLFVDGNFITGLVASSFIEADMSEDSSALTMGVQGEGARRKTKNKSGKITFKLMQTSLSNDILYEIYRRDDLAVNGFHVPIMVRDVSGRSVMFAKSCWIVRMPKTTYDEKITDRTWAFETDRLQMEIRGN